MPAVYHRVGFRVIPLYEEGKKRAQQLVIDETPKDAEYKLVLPKTGIFTGKFSPTEYDHPKQASPGKPYERLKPPRRFAQGLMEYPVSDNSEEVPGSPFAKSTVDPEPVKHKMTGQ